MAKSETGFQGKRRSIPFEPMPSVGGGGFDQRKDTLISIRESFLSSSHAAGPGTAYCQIQCF